MIIFVLQNVFIDFYGAKAATGTETNTTAFPLQMQVIKLVELNTVE